MTRLFAQPYDISANGFYFETAADYLTKSSQLRNDYGAPVEEFEIQFIDGEGIDSQLFNALSISQGTCEKFLDIVNEWDEDDKIKVIIAVGENGYNFDLNKDAPDEFDVDLYQIDSLKELAEQFAEEGLFGDIPERLRNYLDYDAIARDLAMDYNEISVDGTNYVYRCD